MTFSLWGWPRGQMLSSEVTQCQIFRYWHLLWFLRKLFSIKTHFFSQDFPEQLLVQVNPTHVFLRLHMVKNPPKAMSVWQMQ